MPDARRVRPPRLARPEPEGVSRARPCAPLPRAGDLGPSDHQSRLALHLPERPRRRRRSAPPDLLRPARGEEGGARAIHSEGTPMTIQDQLPWDQVTDENLAFFKAIGV